MNLVFDIETVGCEFDSLSETQQEYLLRFAEQESDLSKKEHLIEEAKRYLSLYPFTAKIISLGMLNTENEKTMVLYEGNQEDEWIGEDSDVKYKPVDEAQMLKYFWKYVEKADKVISFNGRYFDVPFIMIRSAFNKIKPGRNLMKNRYDASLHVDLLDQFTFYNLTKKFNLDFYCHSFGIESPKEKGITGMDIKELYKAGRIKDIAVYCGKDVKATYKLFKIWNDYLNI